MPSQQTHKVTTLVHQLLLPTTSEGRQPPIVTSMGKQQALLPRQPTILVIQPQLIEIIMATPHIESKKKDIAPIVLMPGDPKRAEYIAKKYLDKVKLVNQVRGMTAYTGYYKGKRITIFPSGMGIPSIGIYSHELFSFYDVEYIIRVGTMGSYVK